MKQFIYTVVCVSCGTSMTTQPEACCAYLAVLYKLLVVFILCFCLASISTCLTKVLALPYLHVKVKT